MVQHDKLVRSRAKLVEVARAKGRITNQALAKHIGSVAQSVSRYYLGPIWEVEHETGRPDLTVVVVREGSKYGTRLPNSPDIEMDEKNPEHVRMYEDELKRVYECDWPDE